MLMISVTIGSLAIALLIATWVVKANSSDSSAVDPQTALNIEAAGGVQVSGTTKVGQDAPSATFPLLDGGSASLSDFLGTPVVINFWASSCVPCKQEMPALEQVHAAMGSKLRFLGIDVSDSVEAGKKFAKDLGVTYQLGRDPQSKMITAFGGISLPHTVIVDAQGVIRVVHNQALDAEELQGLVDSVVK